MTLRYVHHYTDQHGKERWYFRRPGYRKVALPQPGTEAFTEAYARARAGIELPRREIGVGNSKSGTVASAIAAYYQHNSFTSLAPTTRQMRRAILERFRERDGAKSIADLPPHVVAKILGAKKPFAARNWLKTLRGLMQFAVAIGLRDDDPTAGVKMVKAKAGGFHSWTETDIAQYEARHPIGSRARLAMTLLLYTAARRGDIVRLGPQHVRRGVLSYRQQKTGRQLDIPLHRELSAILAVTPEVHLTYLTTAAGAAFSAAGFGNLFRQWCNEAALPQCSAHGLRKAQSRRLAEAGCSAPQIASITGHKTLSEVQRYIEAAEQAALARAAMETVSRTAIGPPSIRLAKSGEKP